MENSNFTNNLILKFFCFVSFFFLIVDILELKRTYSSFLYSLANSKYNSTIFIEECIQFPHTARAIFTVFSISLCFSTFLMTFIFSLNFEFFNEKMLFTISYYIYYIFGPYLLFFSIYFIINRDKLSSSICEGEYLLNLGII